MLSVRIYYVIAFFMLILISCKKDSSLPPVYMGYDYFPYEVGRYLIYEVDSIVWDDFNKRVDSAHYELKEYVESVFIDNQGRETFRLERSVRFSDTIPWFIADVWYANVTETTAEKVEENIRYMKLAFPPDKYKDWDGNVYNEFDEQTYEYADVHKGYAMTNFSFDSTITVVQQEYLPNLIEGIEAYEVYASKVGMVYRLDYLLKKNTVDYLDTSAYYDIRFELVEYGVQ